MFDFSINNIDSFAELCKLHKLRADFLGQFFASTKEQKSQEYIDIEIAIEEGTFDSVFKKAGNIEK